MRNTLTNYIPKPVRGIKYPGHIRINRRQLQKWLDAGNLFNGFIVGNNVNSFHFFGGWCLACRLDGHNAEAMDTTLNSFHFYLDPELGSRAAIYLRKPSRATVIPPMLPLLLA